MEAAIGLKPLKIGNLVAKHPVVPSIILSSTICIPNFDNNFFVSTPVW